jgi:ATP-binding cassette subfamily B (MDR/TAP) protein 1
MPAAYFETIGSGEVASRMVRDIGLVQVGVGERLGFLMWSASSFVTGSEFFLLDLCAQAPFRRRRLTILFSLSVIVAFYSAPKVAGVIFSIVPFSAIL